MTCRIQQKLSARVHRRSRAQCFPMSHSCPVPCRSFMAASGLAMSTPLVALIEPIAILATVLAVGFVR